MARAATRVDHIGAVRIYDIVQEEGWPWIVMEPLPGRTLQQALDTAGPLPVRQVTRVGLRLVDVLDATHRAGIVHRDVKPGNVHLCGGGRVVLADDMGLGKTIQAIAGAELLRRRRGIERVLVVAPASVKYQWKTEIEKFCNLPAQVIDGLMPYRKKLYASPTFFNLTSYELVLKDIEDMHNMRPDLIILDEAQNSTPEQMKMVLTRQGFNSKMVVTGDVTQIDLPTGRMSGLIEAMKIVHEIEGISFVYFDERYVVRHKLVQQIVKAYEAFSNRNGDQEARAGDES